MLRICVLLFLCFSVSCTRNPFSGKDGRDGKKRGGRRVVSSRPVPPPVRSGFLAIPKMVIFRKANINRRIDFVCKNIKACLRVCQHIEHRGCEEISTSEVLRFWLNRINSYKNPEEAHGDLKWIAEDTEVANFLEASDTHHYVLAALTTHASSSQGCPSFVRQNVEMAFEPYPVLRLGRGLPLASSSEEDGGEEATPLTDQSDLLAAQGLEVEFTNIDQGELPSQALETAAATAADQEDLSSQALEAEANQEENNEEESLALSNGSEENFEGGDQIKWESSEDSSQEEEGTKEEQSSLMAAAAGDTVEHDDPGEEEVLSAGKQEQKVDEPPPPSAGLSLTLPVEYKTIAAEDQSGYLHLPLFMGFMKKCFEDSSKTFSQVAAEAKNISAVMAAHDLLQDACGGNADCVRLAYCELDPSDPLWDFVSEDIKSRGCEYKSFFSLTQDPSSLVSAEPGQ